MSYNVRMGYGPPVSPLHHGKSGGGAYVPRWRCQRRGCVKVVPRTEVACTRHYEGMTVEQREAFRKLLTEYGPTHATTRAALKALDARWAVVA